MTQPPAAPKGEGPPRVLLVEAGLEVPSVVPDWLTAIHGPGAPIRRASSPEEASAVLADETVPLDLVVIETGRELPGATELVRQAARLRPFTPILVVSGDPRRESDLAALEAGASGYLVRGESTAADLDRAVRYGRVEAKRRRSYQEQGERFQALTESLSETVILTSSDGTVVYVSPPVKELLGREPEAFHGRSIFEFIHPEDRDRALEDFRAVVGEVELPGPTEVRVEGPDGLHRMVAASGRNLMNNPAVGGIVVTLRDVTDRHELEERLRHAQKMEAVGRLAGGIAHDFNNILTVLQGHTELLLEGSSSGASIRGDLEEIRKATERATVLTSRLLAFSRRQVLLLQIMDLGEVVRGMEEMLRRLLGSHIELEVDAHAVGSVRADPAQIEQVILNLAVNARDAMPRGGRLAFRVERAEITLEEAKRRPHAVRPGPYVRLTVADEGEGMDAATQDRIFEPFFTTKAVGVGTGLGLAMAYGVVKQSHGYIWVESAPGKGATFQIYLPLVELDEGGTEGTVPGHGTLHPDSA